MGGTCQLSCCGTEPETFSCTQRVVPWSQHFHDVKGPDELFALGLPTGPSEQDVTEGAVHIQQTLRCTWNNFATDPVQASVSLDQLTTNRAPATCLQNPRFQNPIRELLTCKRCSSPPTENSFHPSASFYFLFQNFVLLLARLLARQTDYKYDPSECPHPYPENKSCASQPGSRWSSQDAAQKLQPDGSRTF